MNQYKQTLALVYEQGVMRGDRTGKGRHGVFSPPDEVYDLSKGFPLTTLREIKLKSVIEELIWFISGSTNIDDLPSKFFWKRWVPTDRDAKEYASDTGRSEYDLTDEELARIGTIGNLYGCSWRYAPAPVGRLLPPRPIRDLPPALVKSFLRVNDAGDFPVDYEEFLKFIDADSIDDVVLADLKASIRGAILSKYWESYDQLNELVYKIKTTPNSSRLRVSAYVTNYMAFEEYSPQQNTMDGRACLTPCHTFFQCYVNPGKTEGDQRTLDLKLLLTSSDVPVGRIYNIAQYAILCHMLAQVCGLKPGRLIISTGDAHIYGDQFEAVKTILQRDELPLSTLWLNPEIKNIFDFTAGDIEIRNYQSHPAVVVPVAV